MCLYYALPFFVVMLSKALGRPTWAAAFGQLGLLGSVVIVTFAACWAPFLGSPDDALAVLRRLFPVARGLFEDKVSNFWCIADVAVKLRQLVPAERLALISLCTTLAACVPSLVGLFRAPGRHCFFYSLINCALAFFLFSFQVHEKTILLPALPVAMVFAEEGLVAVWFQLIAAFSMTPLLFRDGQQLSYAACCMLYLVLTSIATAAPASAALQWLFAASLVGCVAIHGLAATVAPPSNLPDIFPLLTCAYSFLHFAGFFVYFHFRQFAVRQFAGAGAKPKRD